MHFPKNWVSFLEKLYIFIPLPFAVSSFDVLNYTCRQTVVDLLIERILVLDLLDLESFLDKRVAMVFYEIERHLVGHTAV